jgi:hypothetical protein
LRRCAGVGEWEICGELMLFISAGFREGWSKRGWLNCSGWVDGGKREKSVSKLEPPRYVD